MNIKVLEMSCCSGGKLQAITEETIKELGINVNNYRRYAKNDGIRCNENTSTYN